MLLSMSPYCTSYCVNFLQPNVALKAKVRTSCAQPELVVSASPVTKKLCASLSECQTLLFDCLPQHIDHPAFCSSSSVQQPHVGHQHGSYRTIDGECDFIEQLRVSTMICNILNSGRGGQRRAAVHIHEEYLEQYDRLLQGKTDAEYTARVRSNSKARKMVAETEDQMANRKSRIQEVCRSACH